MRRGEIAIGAGLACLGVFWAVKSLSLSYMGAFAPGSGFLPFWFGCCLAALSLCFLATKLKTGGGSDSDVVISHEWRKPLLIVAGLAVCVLAIDWIGFIAAVSLYLCYLLGIIERRGWKTTLGVGIGATLVIFVLFRTWLGVPLPLGFFGA